AARLSAVPSLRSATQGQFPETLRQQRLVACSSPNWGPLANLLSPVPLAAVSDLCGIYVSALSALCAPRADPTALWATQARLSWILVPGPFLTQLASNSSKCNGNCARQVIGQSWRVGRACPQRAGLRLTVCGGALRTGAPYLPLSMRSCEKIAKSTNFHASSLGK